MHYKSCIISGEIFTCLLVLIITLTGTTHSQEKYSQDSGDLVQQLIQAYNQFDYKKSAELLNIAFQSIEKFSAEDRIKIYQYAAFIAFRNGNTTLAGNHFWNLLKIDPTFTADPVTTPPKLLTLFQKTKIEYLEDLNRRLKTVSQQYREREIPWRSVVFPGWEQWHRGYRTKGLVLAGAGALSLAGAVHSMIRANQKKDQYNSATNPQRIRTLYDDYNQYYTRTYYFAYGFIAIWAISQIDVALWSEPHIRLRASLSSGPTPNKDFRVVLKIHL